ncbi:MAG TPA: DUF3099 domain-containing protein [Naasia sp.]|jgi:uncharacterized membrane protein
MSTRRPSQSITTLPASPDEDRRSRMIKYSIAMGIRTLCVASLLFVSGWWVLVMIVAAVILPYLAVVVANVGAKPQAPPRVLRPESVVPILLPPQPRPGDTP